MTRKALSCIFRISFVVCFAVACCVSAHAGAPDWLRALSTEPLPSYPAETDHVILLTEMNTVINEKGEMKTFYRVAYKILNTKGREHDHVAVFFDPDTPVSGLKAWAIPAAGEAFEAKEKDALETSMTGSEMYSDRRMKYLHVPFSEPGTVIGYEYEQVRRSDVLQDVWDFQEKVPVRTARYMLTLPKGWEFQERWTNWTKVAGAASDLRTIWELRDLPAVKDEPSMPAWKAVAGRMAISVISGRPELKSRQRVSWADVGSWYWGLSSPQAATSPQLQAKVTELTASFPDTWSKMKAIAAFAQRRVRYVAIEVGIGGYQPHSAPDILTNSYGDCKDKAILVRTMLQQIGVESYMVLTHSSRGVVAADFPTMLSFNHAILAIRVPESVPVDKAVATLDHPKLGRLLIFDPTSSLTPLGSLPGYLQGGRGLLVLSTGGELIDFPAELPSANVIQRSAKLSLNDQGTLQGVIDEVRTGANANEKRHELLALAVSDRRRVIENFLAVFLPGFKLKDYSIENLDDYDHQLLLHYNFEAPSYAKTMGGMWLFRPRVVGEKAELALTAKERSYPVELDSTSLQTDSFDITFPSGYVVDETPIPLETHNDYLRYSSEFKVDGSVLHYKRQYEIDKVMVPVDHIAEVQKFYRSVAADERASVVLKKQ
jgi:predicted transglutaminase-like cysteine proteinase